MPVSYFHLMWVKPVRFSACLPGWNHFKRSCYKLMTAPNPINWYEAEDNCNSSRREGHLVSIQRREEMLFLHTLLLNASDPSLGIYIGNKKNIYHFLGVKYLGNGADLHPIGASV